MSWGRREAQRPVRNVYPISGNGHRASATRTWRVWLWRKIRNTVMITRSTPLNVAWWLGVIVYMVVVGRMTTPGVALLTGAIVALMALVIS